MNKIIISEIEHGKKILNNPGLYWGWESPAGKIRWKRRVEMLKQSIKPGMKVLELGCGTGYFTKELVLTGAEVYAIDISSDLLEKATHAAPNAKFEIIDAHKTNFKDDFFDIVIGSSVLHHLDYQVALHEIYRILKPGGSIYFTEPNMLNPQIALQKNIPFIKEKMGDSPNETAFFGWKLYKDLLSSGFHSVTIQYFDFLHPSIPKSLLWFAIPFTGFLEKIPFIKYFSGSLFIVALK